MRIQGWGFIDLNLDKILLKKTQGNCFPTNDSNVLRLAGKLCEIHSSFRPLQLPTTNLNSSFFINSNLPSPHVLVQNSPKIFRSERYK